MSKFDGSIPCLKMMMLTPVLLSLSACGGGSSSSEPTPTISVGSLSSTVAGLPTNAAPRFLVTGPNNFSSSWDGKTPLNALPFGTYQITVNDIATAQGRFSAEPAQFSIVVDGNESFNVLYQTELVSDGVITGFGSIVVNGTRFNTDNASFVSHNGQLSEVALDLGMVVNVSGRTTADGTIISADNVSYYAVAEGPISTISLAQGTFSVLGQTFTINANTRFVERNFEQLRSGDLVEVSAIGSNQQWIATRVEFYSQLQDDYDVTGFVRALDSNTRTFSLGDLTIDYSRADIEGNLTNGALVSVGALSLPQDNLWQVLDVDVLKQGELESQGQLVLESLIQSLQGSQLTLSNGIVLLLNADTATINADRSELAVGQRVIVKATRSDSGLMANQIQVVKESLIQALGIVTERDSNEIRVNGTEFDVTSTTNIIDKRVSPAKQITLNEVFVGDRVEISGFYAADNDLTASSISVLESSDTPEQNGGGMLDIEGRLTAVTPPDSSGMATLQINGLEITSLAATRYFFNDRFVSADDFFSRVKLNDTIDIDARLVDGKILAYEVEREDERTNHRGLFEIEGSVSTALVNNRFVMSGLSILITETTRFEDGNESALIAGAKLEVKATEDNEGNIVAVVVDFAGDERRDNDSASGELEIEGRITDFNTQDRFVISGQKVALTTNTIFENGVRSDLREGLWVEVEGYLDRDGTLQANHLYLEKEREDDVKGVISQVIDMNQFVVNGVTVELTSRTEFEGGRRSDIAVGRLIEAEGQFISATRLLASEVYFK